MNDKLGWKEAKLRFILKKRETIMRKAFDELKKHSHADKTERYTYYAAKYKDETALKTKYF